MFSAKIEISLNSLSTRSERNVPTTANPPISSGSAAATSPRNTSSSSIARIGKAISSARVRSSRTVSLTSLKPTAKPPTVRSSSSECSLGGIRSAASSRSAWSVCAKWPSISAALPSRERSSGEVRGSNGVRTAATSGSVASDVREALDLGYGPPACARRPSGAAPRPRAPGEGSRPSICAAWSAARALSDCRIGEPRRLEAVSDVAARDDCDRDERRDPGQDPLGVRVRQAGEAVEH